MSAQNAHALQFSGDGSSEEGDTVATTHQFVTFSCGTRNFGVDIMAVREIRSWTPVTEVPDQPEAVRGVLDIRGEVVQVFDLNLLLGNALNEVTEANVVIIVSVSQRNIGILVDAVSDIISVSAKDMRPAPPRVNGGTGVVCNMAKHGDILFSILNLEPLLG